MKKHAITTVIFVLIMFIYYSSDLFVKNAEQASIMLANARYIEWEGSLVFALSELVYIGLYMTIYHIVCFIFTLTK